MRKTCKRCNTEKENIKFSVSKNSKDGLNSWCKDCQSEYKKIRNINRVQKEIDFKFCRKCNNEKEIKLFSKGTDLDGFNIWCKDCQNEYNKEHYIANIDKLKPIRKEWKDTNKDKIKKYNKERYESIDKERLSNLYNSKRDEIKIKRDEYRKTDEYRKWLSEYKIKNSWKDRYRSVLKSVLKRVKTGKNAKTNEILNYTDKEFKLHIESLFIDEMSWNDKDTQIDHIIPIVAFKHDTPINIINSLENLRPMYKSENIKKFTSIDFNHIDLYKKYIEYLIDDYRIKVLSY
jgi:thiol-disulfide isomerase/thioredoxin